MIARTLDITNRLGLHARAAAKLVHLTGQFKSRILIEKDGQEVDGKSILGILMLAAAQGSHIQVRVDGTDEAEAMEAISGLVEDRFEEEE